MIKERKASFQGYFARMRAQCREYFSVCRQELRFHNWSLLQKMSWLYLFAQGAYLLIVCPLQNVQRQTVAMLVAFAVQTLFSGIVRYLSEKTVPSARIVTGLVMFFGIEIMMLALWLGVVAFPRTPALLFPLLLVMMTQIYTLPPWNVLPLTAGSYVLFLLGSGFFKPHGVFLLDIVTGTVALSIALVSYFTLLGFKTDAFLVRQNLRQMSSADDMTGLLNKTTLEFSVEDYLRHCTPGESFALGVIDLDRFKQINDKYGHSMGDSVLIAFASLLQHTFPPGSDTLTGRFGGDEFVVLLKKVSSQEEVEAKFADLLQKTTERNHFEFPVSCSIGVAIADQNNLSFTQIFLSADRALYNAKANGRSQVCVHRYAADADNLPLMLIVESLESTRAILRNSFEDSFRILEAGDGQEALNLILHYQDGISVMLLDTEIPMLSSRALLRRLHGIPKTHGIAVLLLAFQSGGAEAAGDPLIRAVLPKPIQPVEAVAAVNRVMQFKSDAQ
jgi:diguanylate cyclase (GGDEF)-like protein